MAKLLKLRRGTTTQHGSFTGAEGEVTIDTTKDTAVVHDGSTAGGTPLAKENMDNVSSTNIVNRISNSALAGVKVQPNFGSQDIETTGNIDLSDSTGSGNNRIKLGTGDDLQIYHDGTNSYIDNNAGNLIIDGGIHTQFTNVHGEDTAKFLANGAAELYYDNSKKLETHTNGVDIFGRLLLGDSSGANDNRIRLGASGDLSLYHDGTNSHIKNATGALSIKGSQVSFDSADGSEYQIRAVENAQVELYHNGSKKLETQSVGIHVTGDISLTGDYLADDNEKIKFGDSLDLQIYHSGTNSIINNTTGELQFLTDAVMRLNATEYKFNNAANSEKIAEFNADADVELYYDNSKKFETTSTGIAVTGNVACDGIRMGDGDEIRLGSSDDLKIFHDGNNSVIRENGAGDLYLQNGTSNILRIHSSGTSITGNLDVSSGVDVTGNITVTGTVDGRDVASDGSKLDTYQANGSSYLRSDTADTSSGDITFQGGAGAITLSAGSDIRMSNGNWTGDYGAKIQHHDNHLYVQYGSGNFIVRNPSGNNRLTLDQSGNLTAVGNVTAYSDARLKTNVNTINDALSIVGKLRGVSFDWKETGKRSIGVIAQEVEQVIPEVVLNTVETDPTTGKTTEVKSVDYGKIVGVLINAINELKAEIDELKGGK